MLAEAVTNKRDDHSSISPTSSADECFEESLNFGPTSGDSVQITNFIVLERPITISSFWRDQSQYTANVIIGISINFCLAAQDLGTVRLDISLVGNDTLMLIAKSNNCKL